MTTLFDTTVLIDHLRGNEDATSVVFNATANGAVGMARVTDVELASGMRPHQVRAYQQLLRFIEVIDADEEIGNRAVELAIAWGPSHRAIDAIDYLIAATAETRSMQLVTMNVKHFPMFEGLVAPY